MPTQIDDLSVRISADTAPFKAALRALGRETDSFSNAISRAFKDAIIGGRGFEDVLRSLALRIAGLALDRALQPVTTGIGAAIGALFNGIGLARGGVIGDGRVRPFAQGGVVGAPTVFPLQSGVGLMGEAGPEAVLPLTRGSDGSLGVRSAAASPVTVTFNVTTPDADSFRKAETQVTAMLARAVARGRRGL